MPPRSNPSRVQRRNERSAVRTSLGIVPERRRPSKGQRKAIRSRLNASRKQQSAEAAEKAKQRFLGERKAREKEEEQAALRQKRDKRLIKLLEASDEVLLAELRKHGLTNGLSKEVDELFRYSAFSHYGRENVILQIIKKEFPSLESER